MKGKNERSYCGESADEPYVDPAGVESDSNLSMLRAAAVEQPATAGG